MHKVGDVAFALVLVAGVLVLTRPGSKGPALVDSIFSGFANSIGAATGSRGSSRGTGRR